MTYARIRTDLKEKGLRVPLKKGGWVDLDRWTPCTQPDELDSEEFNTIVTINGVEETLASIDLEFKEAK